MRKKTHICLARYMMSNTLYTEFSLHRKAYYVGNILPDCVPSFVTTKHNIESTFPMVKNEIRGLSRLCAIPVISDRYFTRRLGVVLHYLADYFTYPHNEIFTGSLKEHCSYEEELKHKMREFLASPAAMEIRKRTRCLKSTEEMIQYIVCRHREYLLSRPGVDTDCRFILDVCFTVSESMMKLKVSALSHPAVAVAA